MDEDVTFAPPEITDEDIRRACRLLDLGENAFCGQDGADPRQEVLKSMKTMDVAACPGSGKTTLLVAKLAILADKWRERTRGICVLSHTNAARHEIETRLGYTTVGRKLLSYPHFVGTIHGFVNECLALPWLRAKNYPIKMIDDDEVERKRRQLLWNDRRFAALRTYVESRERYQNIVGQWIISTPSFLVSKVDGKPAFKTPGLAAEQLQDLAMNVAERGYHRYDEMIMWAKNLLDTVPTARNAIRLRFPIVFIDEAQDNQESQSAILHQIFLDGERKVISQRFGDPNQAIFKSESTKEPQADLFPYNAVTNLPNSYRFDHSIARLAGPLGSTPYPDGLVGQGRAALALGSSKIRHCVFLFTDDNAKNVLPAYGKLLTETFDDKERDAGVFTAVGMIHRPPREEGIGKFPQHIGHYWQDYDPGLVAQDPQPKTFVQYVLAGMRKACLVGESFPAVEKIAEGVLRLASMADTTIRRRKHSHRSVMQRLELNKEARELYQALLHWFVVRRNVPTREMWNKARRDVVRSIAEAVAGEAIGSAEADEFLSWRQKPNLELATPVNRGRDNLYRYPEEDPNLLIRVGSIHSIKGETHTATLVMETFWNDANLAKLKPWLIGERRGWKEADGVEQKRRLRIHYVAMTRPTHLLCLAMKRSTFQQENGNMDPGLVERLRRHGWHVKCLPAECERCRARTECKSDATIETLD